MKRYKSLLFIFSLVTMMLIVIGGCQPGNVTAPSGGSIEFSPSEITVTDQGSVINTFTAYLTIVVYDSNLQPMNGQDITIFYPWAVPQATVVQLYDGATPVNSPFTAKTDSNGLYHLRVDYMSGGGLAYFGELEVRSGTNFGTASIQVKAAE